MKLKHWTRHQSDCRGNPTPEHKAREAEMAASTAPFKAHPDLLEASGYLDSVKGTSDYEDVEAWHIWALQEAYLAGISAERDRVRIQGVIDAYLSAKDERALLAASDGITALVQEHSQRIRRDFNYRQARRIEGLMRAAGFALDDSDWKLGTYWWHKDSGNRTLVAPEDTDGAAA